MRGLIRMSLDDELKLLYVAITWAKKIVIQPQELTGLA